MTDTNPKPLSTTSETRFATNRGQRIAYDVTGEGPAVVLQHGLLGNRLWGRPYTQSLASGRSLIRIDSLGHGARGSATPSSTFTRPRRR